MAFFLLLVLGWLLLVYSLIKDFVWIRVYKKCLALNCDLLAVSIRVFKKSIKFIEIFAIEKSFASLEKQSRNYKRLCSK
jgi:hypothetical protein